MVFTARTEFVVVGTRPFRESDRLVGELMKRLLHKLRASQSVVNPLRVAAAFGDGCNSGVRLDLDGGLPARAIGPEGGCQPRSAHLAGAGETVEYIVVRMLSKRLHNLFVELLHSSNERTQLPGINLNG